MALNAFQSMVVQTMERSLGPTGDSVTRRVCHELGVTLENLAPHHMADFSRRVYEVTEGLVEEYKRKFLVGTLAKFEKPILSKPKGG